VDETTERLFLVHYLKRGEQEVEALTKQIRARFNNLPRIPLMLKLVAAVYDEKGQVPKNTAALFDDYTEQVLREEKTGIKFTTGLHYAINHLVRETYLRTVGDRGFTENRAVSLLMQIKDELEAHGIKLLPIALLQLLINAGLYKRVGRRLKFFHDSFESYFGARTLESDLSEGNYDLIKQCVGKERLGETWRFLDEIVEDPDDKQVLEKLKLEGTEEFATDDYLITMRDPGVDCYLSLVSQAGAYVGKLFTAEGSQPVQINIAPQELTKLTKEIRREMESMAHEVPSTGLLPPAKLDEYLPHLAMLGHYAFKQIFNEPASLKLEQHLLSKEGGSIQIETDSFFFPWELLYTVDPASALTYENFWGLKYDISRLIVQRPRQNAVVSAASHANVPPKLGLIADATIEFVQEQEIPFFSKLSNTNKLDLYCFPPPTDRLEMLKAFKDFFAHGYDLIHFVCNGKYDEDFAGNSRLQIGNDISLKLIEIETQDMVISGNPLVVLNTAEGGNIDPIRVSGFAASFLRYGARGVVATEGIFPSNTAAAFTELLYPRLLAGDPLGPSLLAVRKALWKENRDPFGLLYSLYARPSFSLKGK